MSSTNLENLRRDGSLDVIPADPKLARNEMNAARTRLEDAGHARISAESRFDGAYAAIREIAEVALLLHGYRTSTSKPGHHQTAIQCLTLTLGIEQSTVRVLDRLRKQRNLTAYEADPIPESVLTECLDQARALVSLIDRRLREKGWA